MNLIEDLGFIMSLRGMGCWFTRVTFPLSCKLGAWSDTSSEK